ncbi:MAG: UDP-N-acetylmuramate:L-alanyl-gamma-D-glutamyl-meso-diaminopimelate ligase [Deltaproteobacteria bacterium]|nr:UDP-N-acetylmuramate:L-alanyl-gamma-D-glutamyl-meso-diaminopimelate ligase [Deltaproteobacteria bacterium]
MIKKHYHFSGICGTAMASLAVLLKNRGHFITGSDENVYPPMSDFLEQNQIPVAQGYSADNLNPRPGFVVLGNALSRGNPEVEYALREHLHYLSMAELLKNDFIRGNRSVVITGTHGKTTTTSLASHVFSSCGKSTGFLVGGMPENFGTSSMDVKKGGYFVVEGDEYDTCFFDKRSKFFHYLPDLLIINNIEFDHADIFNSLNEIKKSFSLMLRQVPDNGLIVVNGDDENAMEVVKTGYTPFLSFGFSDGLDAQIKNVSPIENQLAMSFEICFKGMIYHLRVPLLGEFNVKNATAVFLLALHEKIEPAAVQEAFLSFKNVRRRLQKVSKNEEIMVFDDFAHHPTAISATINAVRQCWPKSRIHAIYEPRSNTSVRNFHQEKMAGAFQMADQITFSRLHRMENIPENQRLDINGIIGELKAAGKKACQIEDADGILKHVTKDLQKGDILLVMSQGDFYGLQRKIVAIVDQSC